MKLLKLSSIMIGAALLAIPASAGTQKGQTELSLFANGSFGVGDALSDSKAMTGILGIGYFFTDAIELKANITGSWIDLGDGDDMTLVGITAGPDYHFNIKDSKFVPYIGVYGGADFALGNDTTSSVGIVDGHAGVKYFIAERTTVNMQVSYQYRFASDVDVGASSILVSFGLSYLF